MTLTSLNSAFTPGQSFNSTAKRFGELIKQTIKQDPYFYLFSPDETTSNKLDAAYAVTSRAWNLPVKPWDLPSTPDGRIVELLSENTLFSLLAGHTLAGGPGIMTSYEAFFSIISSQIIQHLKFIQQSELISWRPQYPAINLLSTSTCWRQDHNGFSHQAPSLISLLLALPNNLTNCFFPIDDIAATENFKFLLSSKNRVNLVTFNKTDEPRWLDPNLTRPADRGIRTFDFAFDPDPDFILIGVGDIASREALYAFKILKQDLPGLKLRFLNLDSLSYKAIGTTDAKLSRSDFIKLTLSRPLIANVHGYPDIVASILSHYQPVDTFSIHGFIEQGSTTTPFEMLSLNQASRYHLAIDVASRANRPDLVSKYQQILQQNRLHAHAVGFDLPIISDFRF